MFSDKFEYVLAVAEEQTLTRAAKRLYMSQPTLTNYLNRPEDELGVKLFDRSTTPIKTTAAGQLYIERMKKYSWKAEFCRKNCGRWEENGPHLPLGSVLPGEVTGWSA